MFRILLVFFVLVASTRAAEVIDLKFLDGSGAYPTPVYIDRDGSGNMVFRDAATAEISLEMLALGGDGGDGLTSATGDARYLRIDGSNSPVTGDVAVSGTLAADDIANHLTEAEINALLNDRLPGSGFGGLYPVYVDGSGTYATVQAAATAAGAAGGGVVILYPGDHAGPVTLPNDVDLIGFARENCTIGADRPGTGVVMAEGTHIFSHVTIENYSELDSRNSALVLLSANGASVVLVSDCVLSGLGSGTLYGPNAAQVNVRDSLVFGAYRIVSTSGTMVMSNAGLYRTGVGTEETFTMLGSGGGGWSISSSYLFGAGTAGTFLFTDDNSTLDLRGFNQALGAETTLFQAGSATGTLTMSGTNFEALGGGGGITITPYEMSPDLATHRIWLEAKDAHVTSATLVWTTSSVAVARQVVQYDGISDALASWDFIPTEYLDGSLYVTVYYSSVGTGAHVFQVGTAGHLANGNLGEAWTWVNLGGTVVSANALTITGPTSIAPSWSAWTSAAHLPVTVAIRRSLTDTETSDVRLYGIEVAYLRK